MGGHGCQVSKVQFPKYERADEPRERGIAPGQDDPGSWAGVFGTVL